MGWGFNGFLTKPQQRHSTHRHSSFSAKHPHHHQVLMTSNVPYAKPASPITNFGVGGSMNAMQIISPTAAIPKIQTNRM